MKRLKIRSLSSRRVRVFDPREVTARGPGEVDPDSVGLGRNDICRFFELLVAGGALDGTRIFSESTVRRAVEPQTPGQVDRMILLPISYSMGFMLGTEPLGLYGFRAGKAFGHVGLSNILAWADPERDISVALTNSGKPFFALDAAYWPEIIRRISTRIPRGGSRFVNRC